MDNETEHYKEWAAQPRKFCSECGVQQSYTQYNSDFDCKCGGGQWVVMSYADSIILWRKFLRKAEAEA